MSEMPDELRELDQKLRSVRFTPRSSFGPELEGRLRRGEEPDGRVFRWPRRHLAAAAATALAVGITLVLTNIGSLGGAKVVTVDRCCYDLDGGAAADDGVLILAEPDARVHRLRVYEDLDGSGSYTPGDLVRLERGREPAVYGASEHAITIDRCCLDFDGGGPKDDGLLIIGVPPDRVLMAAIYETGGKSAAWSGEGWPLR